MNLSFKQGTQEAFDALNSFTQGSLYLTTDKGQLYYAQNDDNVVRIGGLKTCSLDEFNTIDKDINQLYYIPSDCAFGYYNGEAWVLFKLNPLDLIQQLFYIGSNEDEANGRIWIDPSEEQIYSIDGVKF